VHARDIKTSSKYLAPHQFAFLDLKKVTRSDPAGSATLSLGTVFPEGRGTRPADCLAVKGNAVTEKAAVCLTLHGLL
jgi:hypothetical protein